MKSFDVFFDSSTREAIASRIQGVVVGIVTNNDDPEGLNRVKVKFPWLSEEDESYWARIATSVSEAKQNNYELPEVGWEVLVAFEHGDVRFPYILGVLSTGVRND
ncbi:Rhs element Vgr protein [Kalymmatonema gypsitolerans NIES-4073]|nr:Rhs element Vgr protein [Scytonema sp. NIES-4073]